MRIAWISINFPKLHLISHLSRSIAHAACKHRTYPIIESGLEVVEMVIQMKFHKSVSENTKSAKEKVIQLNN